MPLIAPSWQLSIAQPVDTIPGDQAQATGPARRGRTRSGRVAPAIVQPAATPKAAKGRQVDDATWSMVLQHIVFKGYRPWFSDMWSYQLSPAQVRLFFVCFSCFGVLTLYKTHTAKWFPYCAYQAGHVHHGTRLVSVPENDIPRNS